jgi:hypothetical protein
VNQRTKTATLRALKPIKKGAEMLVSYRRQFWSRARGGPRQASRSARKGSVPNEAGDTARQPIVLSSIRCTTAADREKLGSKGGICNRVVPVE